MKRDIRAKEGRAERFGAEGRRIKMSTYLEDVCAQPSQLREALQFYEKTGMMEKMNRIAALPFRRVIFSGMGSSHFCAVAAGIYLKQHGVDNQVISTGELLYYEKELLTPDTLLVLISQSGESAETVRLIGRLPEEITVAAVTNEQDSALARRGQFVFLLHVQKEEAVTTRTYLASVCMTLLLADAVVHRGAAGMFAKLVDSLALMETALARKEEIMETVAPFLEECPVLSLMGRGYSLGSVQAGALFFREIVKQPAMAFDEAEFKHGPLEMVEKGFRAVVFAPSGRTADINCRMAENIVKKGGMAVLVTDDAAQVRAMDGLFVIRLGRAEEYLAPLLQIVPVQLMADGLAKRRGIAAGRFRWGSKIMDSEV